METTNTVTDHTLLSKARKARFDDLPNFSGHPSEDVERFLKTIKRITKAQDETANTEVLEIVRGKLTQGAGIWFDNHEHCFGKWADFESAFRNRYVSATITQQKFDTLKARKQSQGEPVTSYTDEVVELCREVDPTMSDMMIIQYLMSGLNPNFKKELSRRDSSIETLADFLQQAKIEQDLYETFDASRRASPEPMRPQFALQRSGIPSATALINQPHERHRPMQRDDRYRHFTPQQSSGTDRNSIQQQQRRTTVQHDNPANNYPPHSFVSSQSRNNAPTNRGRYDNCKICDRTNHRTIDCFYKRTTGCFRCGQDHLVRDCTTLQNFQ